MRISPALFAVTVACAAGPVAAQDVEQRCANTTGIRFNACIERENEKLRKERAAAAAAGQPVDTGGGGKKAREQNKAIAAANAVAAEASAKAAARDFAGAAEVYRAAIAADPKSPFLARYYTGLAIVQRREAVVAFNNVPRPAPLPPGSTNDQIRAANAAHLVAQRQQLATALPLFRQAQATAAQAAALVAAGSDRELDDAVTQELRENAALLYRLDRAGVMAAPRAGIDYEATALRAWLAKNPTVADATVARFGVATAAALTVKDPAAGLALADEVFARSANDPDGVLGYAEVVAAAKVPAGDPRRAKALAALTRIEPTVADSEKKAALVRLKTALSAA